MFDALVQFVREQYRTLEFIPLHAPVFQGHESGYVQETISSTFVSSVGPFVDRFERDTAAYTGAVRAVATVNGTAALHAALLLAGTERGDLVITQALTFVATCNAIAYCGAEPVFVDVDRYTLGLSPVALQAWLESNARLDDDGTCRDKSSDRRIAACVPMHTFGHPVDLDGLLAVCGRWNLPMVEDAAESLGSLYRGKHTGVFGLLGTLSFNGNKIITTGGGGMILANEELGIRAKHLTTTAKRPHPFEYVHDELGFNYRLPNLNAALGCAQLEQLELFIASKRELATRYADHFADSDFEFFREPEHCRSNYWLNAVICPDRTQRDGLLNASNQAGVMTRPIWQLMCDLPIYAHCRHDGLAQSRWLSERIVNLPSSVLPEHLS
ncbi:LegC family aminotransferase [Pseudomonas sp. SL4(2022)]|uniref:LegC family aminotransferase n=1 Tax=Pseudomonas sp. SL4(2022) TaxID=2994661 RepID=UPI00226EA796|nr:LegC family aminotransferase [Pseudomonas sp. SL4(2022)]WAC44803.1 LegC family aminotransferase [Pseudomonas sp. SL4(2022)]